MKYLRMILPLVVLLMLALPYVVSATPMVQTYEHSWGTINNYTAVYAGYGLAQTITITSESHSVFAVCLCAQRIGSASVGTMVVGLQELNALGYPSGEDIASYSFDTDLASNLTAPHCRYFVMSSEEGFAFNTTYAIVVSCSSGDANNYMNIARMYNSNPYAGGRMMTTNDGGATWFDVNNDDVVFTVMGRPLISVDSVKVFQDCYEDGSMLFTIAYTNLYKPFYPLDDTPSYFTLQLRGTDGVTVIAQTTCNAWGYKPAEIYLNADAAASLDVGEPYMVVLTGELLTETPSANYTLTNTDWMGSNLDKLDTWVIGLAKSIEAYYDIDLLVASGKDELLNDQGAVFFMTGMPSLIGLRPDLFATGSIILPAFEEGTGAFDAATSWDIEVGATVSDAVGDTADMLGIDEPQNLAGILLMFGYFALAGLVVAKGGDMTIAALLAIPVILAGTHLRVVPYAFLVAIGAVGIILLAYRFWWSRT